MMVNVTIKPAAATLLKKITLFDNGALLATTTPNNITHITSIILAAI
jgi:hypothetical protein